MKKLLTFGIMIMLLAGCSQQEKDTAKEEKTKEKTEAVTEEKQETAEPEIIETQNEVDYSDVLLTQAGQSKQDHRGTMTLLKTKTINAVNQIGPVEITIRDVKLYRQDTAPEYFEAFVSVFTDKPQFDFIEIGATVRNTGTQNISFQTLDEVATSNGMTAHLEDDFFLEVYGPLSGSYAANESKEGIFGIILEGTQGEEVQSLTIKTDSIWDDDTQKPIVNPSEIQIQL
jgi:hypothetical protein